MELEYEPEKKKHKKVMIKCELGWITTRARQELVRLVMGTILLIIHHSY